MTVTFETSVRCGNHGAKVYHNSIAAVRECYANRYNEEAIEEAERKAEMAIERYLEDRGYDDARAQEVYENSHGVIQFDQAMRDAGYCDVHGWNVCDGRCLDQPQYEKSHFADDRNQTGSDEIEFAEEDDVENDECYCGGWPHDCR